MAEESFSERSEQATPKKRQDARKKGQVAKSREIPSVLIILGGGGALFLAGSYLYWHLSDLMIQTFRSVGQGDFNPAFLYKKNWELIRSMFFGLSPVLITVSVLAVLSHIVQTGPFISGESLKFDLSRISVIKGTKRLFSKHSAAELAKSILKFIIIATVGYVTVKSNLPELLLLPDQDPGAILTMLLSVSWDLLFRVCLAMLIIAALDFLFQRWSHEKTIRMTKQEVKEEFKQTEGDPLIKSRLRSLQRQMMKNRMMADVPKADVIITNPTHLAIALSYQFKKMDAPRVVAKGYGFLAEKIIEVAKESGVIVVENKPLAWTLYKTLEVGEMIPASLYQAVADILAYVYRLKRRTI